jgi:hypothetical protein
MGANAECARQRGQRVGQLTRVVVRVSSHTLVAAKWIAAPVAAKREAVATCHFPARSAVLTNTWVDAVVHYLGALRANVGVLIHTP